MSDLTRALQDALDRSEDRAPGQSRAEWLAESLTEIKSEGPRAMVRKALAELATLDLENSPITAEYTAWGSVLREAKALLTMALSLPEVRPDPEERERLARSASKRYLAMNPTASRIDYIMGHMQGQSDRTERAS